jgi:hypothetical protein
MPHLLCFAKYRYKTTFAVCTSVLIACSHWLDSFFCHLNIFLFPLLKLFNFLQVLRSLSEYGPTNNSSFVSILLIQIHPLFLGLCMEMSVKRFTTLEIDRLDLDFLKKVDDVRHAQGSPCQVNRLSLNFRIDFNE